MDCCYLLPLKRSFCLLFFFVPPLFSAATFGATGDLPAGVEKVIQNSGDQQIDKDIIRKNKLQPTSKNNKSGNEDLEKVTLSFPKETHCYKIESVSLQSDNTSNVLPPLRYITAQAEGKCLGIEGIRLLAKTLQDEIIRMGYITTRLNMANQDLTQGKLQFEILVGKVGKIHLKEGSGSYISLVNTMPLSEGDTLNLRDLEQGSFNLKRAPGSDVKISVLPGENPGESDIEIAREQNKYWQVAAWIDDAGSKSTGRYQGGGALYLNNITSLSDSLYFSYGRDIDFSHKPYGNSNRGVGYSLPWKYWWLDLYASESESQQHVRGKWSEWTINNRNYYLSAQLNYLLSQTVTHKTTAGLQIFNIGSRYFFNDDIELVSMGKKSAGWKAVVKHSQQWENNSLETTLSLQRKMPWFGSHNSYETKNQLIDRQATIVALNMAGASWFDIAGHKIHYAPQLKLQFTPDRLSSLDRFSIGSRWTVRGFDGESNLQQNQGGYWRNTFSLVMPGKMYQPYFGADVGTLFGSSGQSEGQGKTLMGSVAGFRGWLSNTSYDFFVGLPLIKPDNFHTDSFTLGFSMQWVY